jgi:hypothetical protein
MLLGSVGWGCGDGYLVGVKAALSMVEGAVLCAAAKVLHS